MIRITQRWRWYLELTESRPKSKKSVFSKCLPLLARFLHEAEDADTEPYDEADPLRLHRSLGDRARTDNREFEQEFKGTGSSWILTRR